MSALGSVVECNGGIVILAIIHPLGLRGLILAGELMSIKLTDEILGGRTTRRTTGVDVANEHPLILVCSLHIHLHKVGTLPHTTMITIFSTEITLVLPLLKVLRRIDAHLLTSCKNHIPESSFFVPEDMRVTEIRHIGSDDGVVGIFCEGLATIGAICQRLSLTCAGSSVEGNNSILAKTCGVVLINNTTSAEHHTQGIGFQSCRFCFPIYEVGACGMSP